MAAVEITISGVLIDKYGRTVRPCTIVGEATLTGLGVGGGPIIPPGQPPAGGGGPVDPGYGYPVSPVDPGYGYPLPPGYRPPGIWPGPGPLPHPEHPIVIPPPPTEPPTDLPPDGGIKPPPPGGGWGFHPIYGWGYFPGPGQPGPK